MKNKRAKLKDIRAGKTIYNVLALGKQSYIEKLYCTSKPFQHKLSICFSTFAGMSSCAEYVENFGKWNDFDIKSLVDMNVVPNSYNAHHAFTSRRKAEQYLKHCMHHNIDSSVDVEVDYDYDYGYEYDCAHGLVHGPESILS